MKTAEHWAARVQNSKEPWERLVAEIQRDALQHAANIANQYRDYDQSRDSLPIVREILAAMPDHEDVPVL